MRHVDDAHLAEGDGEADGGEQEDRAEADAVDDVLQPPPQGACVRCRRTADNAAVRSVSGVSAGSERSSAAVLVAARGKGRDGGQAVRIGRSEPWSRRSRRAPPRARGGRRSCFRATGPCSITGRRLASRDLNTASAALMRFCGSARGSGRRADRAFDDAAQPVVEQHRPQGLGVGVDGVTAFGVAQSTDGIAIDDSLIGRAQEQAVGEKRGEQSSAVAWPRLGEPLDAHLRVVELVGREAAKASSIASARAAPAAAEDRIRPASKRPGQRMKRMGFQHAA